MSKEIVGAPLLIVVGGRFQLRWCQNGDQRRDASRRLCKQARNLFNVRDLPGT